MVPWKIGKFLVWEARCPDTFVVFHSTLATRKAGEMVAMIKTLKKEKHT